MTIANTTVISNLASTGQLDLLHELLGEIYISTDVFAEIQDGLTAGYLFYRGIEQFIYPFTPTGWLRLTSLQTDEEFRVFHRLPAGLH